MIEFAATGWQIFVAFTVLLTGIFYSVYQKSFLSITPKLSVSLYIYHTSICLYYYYYSLHNVTDAKSYYLLSLKYNEEFNIGTDAITFFVSVMTSLLDMSYGDVFLVFNIIGFIGLLAWGGALFELLPDWHLFSRRCVIAVLFLPGVSFWSSGIGKDSPAFMATGLAAWASLQPRRRYPAMLCALSIFVLVRPHIGGIAIVSLALTLIFTIRSGIAAKAALLTGVVPAAAAGLWLGMDYAGISNPSSMTDISSYIEERQGSNMEGGSSIDIASMSWPVRLFSYLFRPLPLESPSLLGVVAGFENLVLLVICAFALFRALKERGRLPLFPRAFMLLFACGTLIILANTTANLGIALRQKWMFVPLLICVAFSYAGPLREKGKGKIRKLPLLK